METATLLPECGRKRRAIPECTIGTIFKLSDRVAETIEVRQGDLLDSGSYDAIINSANETLEGPLFPYFPIGAECESGDVFYQEDVVDGQIHKAGGPALSRLCRKLPELPPNDDPEAPYPSAYTQRCEIGGARLTEVPDKSHLVKRPCLKSRATGGVSK
ncbi:unnamed protein product [Durusdinium trenchii]|uniref:Uncharacterized protein n=1 Tax=Durusdinium trenchii TaxID=1381693 RepID=A0ABP0RC82_9DINO